MTLKVYTDSSSKEFKILKGDWCPERGSLPPVVPPPELSTERQWYLYGQIRPYCTPSTQDKVCPFPTVPKPSSNNQQAISLLASLTSSCLTSPWPSPPPTSPKRRRTCSVCGQAGHNARKHLNNYYELIYLSINKLRVLYYITSLPKHHVPMEGGGLVKPQGTLPSSAFCTLHPWGNVGTTGAGGARPYLAPTCILGTHPHLWRNEHAPYALANHTHNIICSCGQGSTNYIRHKHYC